MTEIKRNYKLVRVARRGGADRYQEDLQEGEHSVLKTIYLEQYYSRAKGDVLKEFEVTITLP